MAWRGATADHSGFRPTALSYPFAQISGLADELRAFLQDRNTIPTSCVAHSRAALKQVGFWPEDVPFAADWVLWRRMITRGGSAAYLRQPTNLHFSANWKQSQFSGISEVKVLLEIADNASWWRSILRNTPAAEPEQATIWRAIKIGGDPWVEICAKRRRRLSTGSHGWPCVISTPVLRQHLQLRQDQRWLRFFEQKLRLCALVLPCGASTAPLRNIARRLRSQRLPAEFTRDRQVPLRRTIRKAQSAHMFPLHRRKPPLDFVV